MGKQWKNNQPAQAGLATTINSSDTVLVPIAAPEPVETPAARDIREAEHERLEREQQQIRLQQDAISKHSPTDTLAFAKLDIERGLVQLRQNSAAPTPGTYIHAAVTHFHDALARLAGGLKRHRGDISAEDEAKVRQQYEAEYRGTAPEAHQPKS